MPRTDITITDRLSHDVKLLVLQATDSANGMQVENDGRTRFVITTAGTGATVTFKSVQDSNRRTGDVALVMGTNETIDTSFFQQNLFNQTDGKLYVDFSADTDVKIVAIKQSF